MVDPQKGHYSVGMKALLLLVATTALVAVPAAGAGASATSAPSALAAVKVVGSGTIAWPSVAVRSQPSRTAPVLKTMTQFDFYVNGKVVRTGKIAVGKTGMETPTGLFYVQAKFDPSLPILGAYAFETSGYSKLSDWPGGGVVGVHGTNTPELIGQAVSHGCVRLLNKDMQYLRSVVPVGTPVKIVAA